MDAAANLSQGRSPWKDLAPWLALVGGLLAAVGYGLLALANLQISGIYRTGGQGDIAGAYLLGATGDVMVGAGLFLAIAGLAILLRR